MLGTRKGSVKPVSTASRNRLPLVIAAVAIALIGAGTVLFGFVPRPASPGTAPTAAPARSQAPADDVILLQPAELATLFARPPAAPFDNADGPFRLTVERAGDVTLATGRVVAADVFINDVPAFADRLAPGKVPVSVLVATRDGNPAIDYVAAAVLGDVADLDRLTWANAFRDRDDPAVFKPDDVVSYGVDSGTGSFTSPEAVVAMRGDEHVSDRLLAALQAMGFGHWTSFTVVPGVDLVAFPSGVGDGAYPTWVGRDASGSPVAFLTDFGILAHRSGHDAGAR